MVNKPRDKALFAGAGDASGVLFMVVIVFVQ